MLLDTVCNLCVIGRPEPDLCQISGADADPDFRESWTIMNALIDI